jgi:hypothetical protein
MKAATSTMSLDKPLITERSKQKDMLFNTCYYQLRKNKILKYEFSELRSEKQREEIEMVNNLQFNNYNGEISETGKKKLAKHIELWYQNLEFYNKQKIHVLQHDHKELTFVTLTLPSSQFHSDQEIKQGILKPFLRRIKEKTQSVNYIWKAESQANGNIHFHVILEVYLYKEELTEIWNKCCENLGYISEFEKKHHHRNPPSTEIRGIKNYKAATTYLSKYICKSSDYRKIEGAVWKASKSIASLEYFEFISDGETDMKVNSLIENEQIKYYSTDRYMIIYLMANRFNEVLNSKTFESYMEYRKKSIEYLWYNQEDITFKEFVFNKNKHKIKSIIMEDKKVNHSKIESIQLELFANAYVPVQISIQERETKEKKSKKHEEIYTVHKVSQYLPNI